ncbi:MAG: copper-binding protein [Alphaproteobacteria bacterium]
MKNFTRLVVCASIALALGAMPAEAAGDLAIKATALTPLQLGIGDNDYALSVKEYRLETGKSYRLKISAGGYKKYEFQAPEFFRNIWVRKIVAGDVEIDAPTINALEFEEESSIDLHFVPVRTGDYELNIEGLEEKGMVGKFVVR